jgi:uncharacterized spore protein YtfJ
MDILEIVRRAGETLSTGATVRNVYGEPITVGQRTVLPVAKVRFGFGGGGGSRNDGERPGGGGGGGGRVRLDPCGLVEVTPEGARFIYFRENEPLAAALAAGIVVGLALAWFGRCR